MKLKWKISWKPSLKLDLAANFVGVGWYALLQLVCIPLYLKFLGIEAYGLIGFYLMLQASLQVLDFGLSPTMNREMARYSVRPEKAAEARDLVRTLETCYWLIGIAIGALILAASPVIAKHWIRAGSVSIREVQRAVMLMGALAVFQWPVSFYQGGLLGLRRQVLSNAVNVFFSTLANGGAVLVLWRISPTIQAFFVWLIAVNATKAVVLVICLWKSLPPATRPPAFDLKRVRSIRRFAVGMSGITLCALILTQSDKIVVSRLLDLKTFGYYSIAGMFGTGLSLIVNSVFNTIFPRFSALATVNENELKHAYHRYTQLMAVLILPLAVLFALSSSDILRLWTRNAEVARHAGPIAALLVMGSALNGLMNLPYALQLAYGWTSIALRIALFLTVISIPAIWFMTRSYGGVGAASVWLGLNGVYMLIGIPLTHRRLLKGEAWRWLCEIGSPLVPILLVVVIGRQFVGASTAAPAAFCVLLTILCCATGAAALVSPSIRLWLRNQLLRPKIVCEAE
jgi:O-antigen/teichoic acid export membrane protein